MGARPSLVLAVFPAPAAAGPMRDTIKVLFLAADPFDDGEYGDRLKLDEEVRAVAQAIRASTQRGVELVSALALRTGDLQAELLHQHPDVLHFAGHAGAASGIKVGGEYGYPEPLPFDAFAETVAIAGRGVRLVVLNACHSAAAAKPFQEVVDYVVVMNAPIHDGSARVFAAAFYNALASAMTVGDAFRLGVARVRAERRSDASVPELYVRPGVDGSIPLVTPRPAGAPGGRQKLTIGAARPPQSLSAETTQPPKSEAAGPTAPDAAAKPPVGAPPRGVGARVPAFFTRWGVAIGIAVALAAATALIVWPPPTVPHAVVAQPADDGPWQTVYLAEGHPPQAASAAAQDGGSGEMDEARALYAAGNYAAAFPIFRRAAEGHDLDAMAFVGICYLTGRGTRADPTTGVELLRRAAYQRNPLAMNALGVAYETGTGVGASHPRARNWYEIAAAKGYPPALRNLARMYRDGLGVPPDPREASRLYQQAADAGSVDALVDLAMLYDHGPRGVRDVPQAIKLYRDAAEKGSARGMVALALAYQNGDGLHRSAANARVWYLKAADAGSGEAMNNLGVLYLNGWGVPGPDRSEAVGWFRRGKDAGSSIAAANLAALGER
jgi:TPR repeat protein